MGFGGPFFQQKNLERPMLTVSVRAASRVCSVSRLHIRNAIRPLL
jgi:hypothetical protein